MRSLAIFFIMILSLLVFLLAQFPVILGWRAEEVRRAIGQTDVIELSGKTLFVSDLHLISGMPIEEQFNLDFGDMENFVIVGDFFHSPNQFASFGDSNEARLRNVLADLVPADFTGGIYYIFGESHDPTLPDIDELEFSSYHFRYLGNYGRFDVDGTPVTAFHGQQLHGGVIGGGVSWLSKKLGYVLPLERLGRKRFYIPEDTWLITGHSHVSALDKNSKTANTGSFVGAPFNKIIFRIHIGTGILFDEGHVELLEFEGLNLKNLYPLAL